MLLPENDLIKVFFVKAEEVSLETGVYLGAITECFVSEVVVVIIEMVVVDSPAGDGDLFVESVIKCSSCELMVLFLLIMVVVTG